MDEAALIAMTRARRQESRQLYAAAMVLRARYVAVRRDLAQAVRAAMRTRRQAEGIRRQAETLLGAAAGRGLLGGVRELP